MRNFQALDHIIVDEETETLQLEHTNSENDPLLVMHREGLYVAISASFGPMELALRPRYEDLVRTLERLQAIEGLQTTRQVGTAQAYMSIGLSMEGELLLRPTIVADATGHLTINLRLTPAAREAVFTWLGVGVPRED